jgi:protein-tyrosine phosphatase
MISGRIDVHAHLLPGVDDGCATLDDSVACARMLVAAGYTHACCTPHVWPTLQGNTVVAIRSRTAQLQQQLESIQVPLRLIPGGEINLEWNWPAIGSAPPEQIVSYGLAGKHLLFDFWADTFPDFLPPAVKHLQALGYTLIMAHPERVRAVQDDPAVADRFIEMAILLQCNTWCLTDPTGTPTRDVSERLLRAGRYFLLGTDLHDPATLPIRIEGLRRAIELVGDDAINQLTIANPRQLFD